jgi:hypothetical protein
MHSMNRIVVVIESKSTYIEIFKFFTVCKKTHRFTKVKFFLVFFGSLSTKIRNNVLYSWDRILIGNFKAISMTIFSSEIDFWDFKRHNFSFVCIQNKCILSSTKVKYFSFNDQSKENTKKNPLSFSLPSAAIVSGILSREKPLSLSLASCRK